MSLKLDDSNESDSKTRQVKNGEKDSRMCEQPKKVKKKKKKAQPVQQWKEIQGRESKVSKDQS